MRKILGLMMQADKDYQLIEDNDCIAVGVSGGKDSLLLLKALLLYQRYSKKQFQIIAIHVDVNFPNSDFSKVVSWSQENNITLHIISTKIYQILLQYSDDKICCSRCSNLKKGALIKAAKQLGCNKVALGHHQDDVVETLFLNLIYGGKTETFPPKFLLTRENVELIRPFYLLPETLILPQIQDLPVIISNCPRDKKTKRQEIKNTLLDIYGTYHEARKNLFNAIIKDKLYRH